jgi:UV excision repair protein RAD23
MRISVKTLKGEQFQIDVDPACKIAEVKEVIEREKGELPAARQKLIHSGKVLKDSQELSETGIAENEFLVCMLTKEAKPRAKAMVENPTPTPPVSTPAPQVTQQQQTTSTTQSVPPTTTQQPTTPAPQTQTQIPPAPSRETNINPEAVRQLMDMGFPEEEATTALRAAMGNPDVAVEFLMNGIPPHALAAAGMGGDNQDTSLNESTDSGSGGGIGIEQLRAHPQLNELRRVVQSNPSALSQVLEAIGQQNPALLQLIHANQAEFLAMMNEPITEDPPQQQQQQQQQLPPANLSSGEPNPMQLIQMIQQLPEEQRAAAAQSLGMSPEQLQAFSQMISQLPPAELQALLGQVAQARGGAGGGGGPPGGNVIRLSEEEMNSVNRLTELGFDQQDAVQAYLACDKNEALAANMLMDGWNNDDNLGGGN